MGTEKREVGGERRNEEKEDRGRMAIPPGGQRS